MNDKQKEISKLQDNLALIRKVAGWSSSELAEKLDISRQSLSKIENKTVKMSQTTYIAIRTLLDYEIEQNPNNEVLIAVVKMCLEEKELTDEDRDKVETFLTGAKKTGLDNTVVIAGIAALAGLAVGTLIGAKMVPSTTWLATILKKKK